MDLLAMISSNHDIWSSRHGNYYTNAFHLLKHFENLQCINHFRFILYFTYIGIRMKPGGWEDWNPSNFYCHSIGNVFFSLQMCPDNLNSLSSSEHQLLCSHVTNVTSPAKINHMDTRNLPSFSTLLCYNFYCTFHIVKIFLPIIKLLI